MQQPNADGEYLARTQTPDVKARQVGYFPHQLLLSEEEVYKQFMADEDARLKAELENQKRTQDSAAEELVLLPCCWQCRTHALHPTVLHIAKDWAAPAFSCVCPQFLRET